jgi:hypothetical protein
MNPPWLIGLGDSAAFHGAGAVNVNSPTLSVSAARVIAIPAKTKSKVGMVCFMTPTNADFQPGKVEMSIRGSRPLSRCESQALPD